MARTFSLSANIENGFAEGSQYLVTPNAQNAIHNIVNDFRSGIHSFTIIGSYGTGKSSFLLALEADLKKTGKQKYLLDSKNLSDAKSFEIMNIVGDYAEMSTLLSKALNVEGNTISILDSLKNYYAKCQKKGKFLLIVIDEFGKVLEHAAKNNPEKELYFLQKLSELVNVPTRQMMLLTTLHQNFGAYAKGLTEAQANEWTKVKGRFKEITFVEPVEQLLYLASAQLQATKEFMPDDSIVTLYELAKETRYVSKDFPLETAIQLYPLDLFSAYTITTAIQRYGQNERSLFTFLAAKGTNSISEFEPAEHLTYNLQKVYDYILYNFYSYLKDANADSMSWTLADNCIRTWLYINDVDNRYKGMVRARNEVFAQEGLTEHFIASTGIAGRQADPKIFVQMDAYAIRGIMPSQIHYLHASDHLNRTIEYGVSFERGTYVDHSDRRHIFISGTASINNQGQVMYEHDIRRQTDRMLENVQALLSEAGATYANVAPMIVYLRDPADYTVVRDIYEECFPDKPVVFLHAPVCRPGWLIEMECMAVL